MRASQWVVAVVAVLCQVVASRASADDAPAVHPFDDFQEANEMTCVGAPDAHMPAAEAYDVGGFHYAIDGAHAKVSRLKPRAHADVHIGIVNAIKDDTPETQANLAEYFARFKSEDVDAILVGGDTAYGEDDIQSILERVGATDVPVYAVIGNAETRSAWNRAARAAWQNHKNILNVDLVRVVTADGFNLVSLAGYYDKRFTSSVAPCLYTPDDLKQLPSLFTGLTGPTVFLTHGPPKQSGRNTIDFTPQAGNVGDPDLADVLARAKVAFGVFGHIVEAGGHATDASGKREIKPGTLSDTLYLNPGSANSAPWRMNVGPESWGMGAILVLEGGKAKYEIIHSAQRVGK
jgi:Icc-related predicted phosphoesterase